MDENKIDNIKNHLEFLGYDVESRTDDKGTKSLAAKSQGKPNLFIWFGKPEENRQHVLFSSTWNGVKKVNTVEQFNYINKLNNDLLVTKVFIDFSDDTLMFRGAYTADYNKKAFGDFLDLFLDGIKQAMVGDEFKKLFLDESK